MIGQMPERRRYKRFALMLSAGLRYGPHKIPDQGRLVDLSESGASVSAKVEQELGQSVYLSFKIRPDTLCEATGNVCRIMPLGPEYGLAIEFAYANNALLNFLRNLDATPAAGHPDYLSDIIDLVIQFG
jgi:hypothetical protein